MKLAEVQLRPYTTVKSIQNRLKKYSLSPIYGIIDDIVDNYGIIDDTVDRRKIELLSDFVSILQRCKALNELLPVSFKCY